MIVEEKKLYIEALERDVTLFIYVPNNDVKEYRVLYMHDGQNLFFDDAAAYGASWKMIENLERANMNDVMVVGIENANDFHCRIDEYSPWLNDEIFKKYQDMVKRAVGGKGDLYLDALVNIIKPYIDQNYPTSQKAEHTAMAGSSMGGFITLYAAIKYPHIFSRFACMSNAFWVDYEKMLELVKATDFSNVKKLYLDTGDQESDDGSDEYVKSNLGIHEVLKSKIDRSCYRFEIIEGAKHFEVDWANRMSDVLQFVFDKG